MKKNLFVVATLLFMAACSNNGVDVEKPLSISFETDIDNTLKLSTFGTIDLATLKSSPDGFAVLTEGLGSRGEMDNLVVKYSERSWAYAGNYYWPIDAAQDVSFAAFAPAGMKEVKLTDKGLVILDYTPSTSPENQIDLLYAPAMKVNRGTAGANGVSLIFNHILTQVAFSVTTDIPAADEPKIVSIALTVPRSKGEFREGEWKVVSNSQTYTVFKNNPISSKAIASTPLLMIPQEVAEGTTAVITFSVKGVESRSTIDLNTLKAIESWQKGYKVTYNLSFLYADLKVKFADPTVGTFTSAADGITY